jgi:hypothetical protein
MDEREYRDQPVAEPLGQWMVPSDRMVVRRYKNLDHLASMASQTVSLIRQFEDLGLGRTSITYGTTR